MRKREREKRLRIIWALSEELDIPPGDLWWILSDRMLNVAGYLMIGHHILRDFMLTIVLRDLETLHAAKQVAE